MLYPAQGYSNYQGEHIMTDSMPVKYNYDLQKATNFGASLHQSIENNTKRHLELTKTGEFQSNVADKLVELKQEVTSMPNVTQRSFFDRFKNNILVKRIEESKTRLTSVQSLLDTIKNESNKHVQALEGNIKDTTAFLDSTTKYINEANELLGFLQEKIAQTKADGNPDEVAKNFYLQMLYSREEEIKGSIIMLQQQRDQVSQLRGASLVSSQKLKSTLNLAIPLLSSQLAQTIMVMKLERSNNTIDALTNSINELSRSNTEIWSKAMIRTAEQQKEGMVDLNIIEENRNLILQTTEQVIEIQNSTDQARIEQLEKHFKLALDDFSGNTDTSKRLIFEDKLPKGSNQIETPTLDTSSLL